MAPSDGVKEAVVAKTTKFRRYIRLYDPARHEAEVLVSNKDTWMTTVDKGYTELLDFTEEVTAKPGVEANVIAEANRVVDEVELEFQKFLSDFNKKCSTVAAPPGGAAAALQPRVPQPGVPAPPPLSRGSTVQSVDVNAEKARLAAVEVEIDAEKVTDGVKTLKLEIRKHDDWSAAESYEIEQGMAKVDPWKKQIKSLKDLVFGIKKNVNCFHLDNVALIRCEASVNTLSAELDLVIQYIQHEDKERRLYSLTKSKPADLKYPKYGGGIDEDFLKFKREMENALRANKVTAEDVVDKLRDNLSGEPLSAVPKTTKTLEDAWLLLDPIYGDAGRVMDAKKTKLQALGKFPKSNVKTAANLRSQIQWYLALEVDIKDLYEIAELSDEMDREVFNLSTYRMLLKPFPLDVDKKLGSVTGSARDKIEALYSYITEEREECQNALKHLHADVLSGGNKDKQAKKDWNSSANVTFKPPQRYENCRICTVLDGEGKTSGLYEAHTADNGAGCPVFAAMKMSDRWKYATKAKMCIFCLDGDFVFRGGGHKHTNCPAFKKRCYFTCNHGSCKKHFLICSEHRNTNNEKLEKCKTFWEEKGRKFSTNTVLVKASNGNASVASAPQLAADQSPSSTVPPSITVVSPNISLISTSAPVPQVTPAVTPPTVIVTPPLAVVSSSPEPEPVNLTTVTSPEAPSADNIQNVSVCDGNNVYEKAADYLRKVSGVDAVVHDVPEGEPIFMFSQAVGKTRPVNIFYDSGCSHAMVKQEACDTQLDSVMVRKGPIPINAVGATTVYVNAEYAILLEKTDNSKQILMSVTADNLTSFFPPVSLTEAHKDILAKTPKHKKQRVSQLKLPEEAGGEVDVLLGILYKSCYPQILHVLDSGLFIAKLKLKSHDGVTTGCIGGPHQSFSALVKQAGDVSILLSSFVTGLESFRKYGPPKISGPIMSAEDYDLAHFFNKSEAVDIAGVEPEDIKKRVFTGVENEVPQKSIENMMQTEIEKFGFTMQCTICGDDVLENVKEIVAGIKDDIGERRIKTLLAAYDSDPYEKLSDLKILTKIQEQCGVDIQYRCPRCRDCQRCKSGPGTERISLREEQEDEMIRESIMINYDEKRIDAVMPMRGDPAEYLSNNRVIAEKVLEAQCKKVQNDPEAKAMVVKAFDKLRKNKYAVEFSELTPEQQENIRSKYPQHWLAWRCVYKLSISTPCRPAFDASMKTPLLESGKGGRCLNDLTVKGKVSTLNLLNMLLRFFVGSSAVCGDIKQFYNRINLDENQWHLQRCLYKEGLDVNSETVELVITTLIYGVRCVSGLSEAAILELARKVSKSNPRLEIFLTDARFCDDIADSDVDGGAVTNLIDAANELFESVGLECKGWSVSGQDPHPDVTNDGVSVDVGGMTWFPKIDSVVVKVPPLHFGRKLRGRLRVGTEIFDGSFSELQTFVPYGLTRRMITSKFASFFDPLGKFIPITSGMKADLRKVVLESPSWDLPVKVETRQLWVKNLWRLHKQRGIQFNRAVIPSDAVDTKLELICAVDAADLKVAGVWGRFKRRNGQFSCQLIVGRSLLAKTDSTIPKEELESLCIGSNLLFIVRKALGDWVSDYVILSDSAIAICWTLNEDKRMSIYHRNRANQIRFNTDISKLMHVRSEYNCADIPTRPECVQDHHVGPNSSWEKGLPWMNESLEKAIDDDILKPASEMRLEKLDDKDAAEADRGFIIENDLEILVKGHYSDVRSNHADRVDEMHYRATTSRYLFMPKFSFAKVVRITGFVMKFVNKIKARLRVKAHSGFTHTEKIKFETEDISEKAKLLPTNLVAEVRKSGEKKSAEKTVILTDEEIQRALLYWYRKATLEVWQFNKKETIKKIGVEKEGILFCKSRILDGQRFLQTGEFGDEDLGLDIGLHLLTPLIDRYSPIALSIAIWVHHEVLPHAGFESTYRASLGFAHIIRGPSLFKEIGEECAKCNRVRRKFLDIAMGPIQDHQLAVCPPFHTAFLDLDGPYTIYVPGFERETRNRKTLATKNYIMTFVCPVSKAVNLQVIENKEADGVCEGLTRLGCEQGFPKFLVLDKESSFMKVVKDAEIDLQDVALRCWKEHGIKFQTAPVAAHNFNGLVERKIRSVQESFEKIELKKMRLHSTGLQTFAKCVENLLNNLPLGFAFGKDATTTPLLKLITPNMLKLGRLNSRSLSGPIKLPKGPKPMMDKLEKIYNAFFRIWNVSMVPKMIPSPKWYKTDPELKIDDVVFFRKVDNDISSKWMVGQIDSVQRGKDKVIRRIVVRYKNASEVNDKGRGPVRTTERSARDVVKLFNIEDQYFVRDMEQVESLMKELEQTQWETVKDVEELPQTAEAMDNDDTVTEVTRLKVTTDNDDTTELIHDKTASSAASANISRTCRCCCIGHCRLMSWDQGHFKGYNTGVTLQRLVDRDSMDALDLNMAYTKEYITDRDMYIRPELHIEEEVDEAYGMLTALETDFSLE